MSNFIGNVNSNSGKSLTEHSDSSTMNILSPEVSLNEGNSPVRMEDLASGSHPFADKMTQNLDKDSVTIKIEDGLLPLGHEQEVEASDYDGSYLSGAGAGDSGNESSSESDGGIFGVRSSKRSFSSSLNLNVKPKYAGGRVGSAAKRHRVASTTTNGSSTQINDPIGQYLAEMVDIEKERVEVERKRAENEREMMMGMMQILQTIVFSSNQSQEGKQEENETENDREANETEFDETEHEADDDEIRQMIREDSYGEPAND